MITYNRIRPDIVRMDENSFRGSREVIASEAVVRVLLERVCELSAVMLQKGRDGIAGMSRDGEYAAEEVKIRATRFKKSLLNPIPDDEEFNGFVSSGPKPLLFSGNMPDFFEYVTVDLRNSSNRIRIATEMMQVSAVYGGLWLVLDILLSAVEDNLGLIINGRGNREDSAQIVTVLLESRFGFSSDYPAASGVSVEAVISPDVLAIIGHTLMTCANGLLLGNTAIKIKLLKLLRKTVGITDFENVLRVMAVDKSNRVRKTVFATLRKLQWTSTRLIDKAHQENRAAAVVPGSRWRVRHHNAEDKPVKTWDGASTVTELMEFLGIKSPRQLAWLLTGGLKHGDQERTYRVWEIPKRTGGTRRIISPCDTLKWVQRRILTQILDTLPVSESAHGFVKGRSIASNARAHIGAVVTIKFDLSDFFDRISYLRVRGLFMSLGFPDKKNDGANCPHPSEVVGSTDGEYYIRHDQAVATVLAALCCVRYSYELDDAATPQGAPTSPAIANLLCRNLDNRIRGYVRSLEKYATYTDDPRSKAVYTRYADDLTISFKRDPFTNVNLNIGRLKWAVGEMVLQEGFPLNPKKFAVIRKGGRRLVTGLVVSQEKVSVPRETVAMVRAVLHNCEKHGVEANRRERGAGFEFWLKGMVSYINMARPDVGAKFRAKLVKLGLLKYYTARPKVA